MSRYGLNTGLQEGGELHRNEKELEEEVEDKEPSSVAGRRMGISDKVNEEFSGHDASRK